jgi:hypothetical protein
MGLHALEIGAKKFLRNAVWNTFRGRGLNAWVRGRYNRVELVGYEMFG